MSIEQFHTCGACHVQVTPLISPHRTETVWSRPRLHVPASGCAMHLNCDCRWWVVPHKASARRFTPLVSVPIRASGMRRCISRWIVRDSYEPHPPFFDWASFGRVARVRRGHPRLWDQPGVLSLWPTAGRQRGNPCSNQFEIRVVAASQSSAIHYGQPVHSENNLARASPKNLAFRNEADRKTERNRQRP
jgi:hypothetical protein